jgi:hypothetical protein|tara:strand:+ start:1256 stop:1648 length:393 start_codon:yes stop_codon:yes gene_type:complete
MSDYQLKPNDLIFYKEGGATKSLGFEINNKYLNNMPAIVQIAGAKGKSPFAVPAGLFLMHQKLNNMGGIKIEDVNVIQEGGGHEPVDVGLYDKLLAFAASGGRKSKKNKPPNTRKKRKKQNRTTRKKKLN